MSETKVVIDPVDWDCQKDKVAFDPADWVCQKDLAKLLDVCPKTICIWAAQGRLRRFEHGFELAGKRRYSLRLLNEAFK